MKSASFQVSESSLSRRSLLKFGGVLAISGLTGCATDPNSDFDRDSSVIVAAKKFGLIHVPAEIPSIKIDLRYRTRHNATGKPLYPQDMPCLLHRSAVDKVAVAQRILRRKGYGLKILDAWRPPESHRALWNAVRDPRWVVPP